MKTYAKSKTPFYLINSHCGYRFRIEIPIDVQDDFGRKEIRISLPPAKRSEAKHLCLVLAGSMWKLFDQVRSGKMARLSPDEMNEIVRSYAKTELEKWELNRLAGKRLTGNDVIRETRILRKEAEKRKQELILNDFTDVAKKCMNCYKSVCKSSF